MCHPGIANRIKLDLIYIHFKSPSRLLLHWDRRDEGEGNLQRTSISTAVQLRQLDWADEGRLSALFSIYPHLSLNKKGWSSTTHVPSHHTGPRIREHANAFASLSGLTMPCGCLKSRRHSATGSGMLSRDAGHLEGMRQEIRVEEYQCRVSSWIKKKKKAAVRSIQNHKSHSLRVRPSFSTEGTRLLTLS